MKKERYVMSKTVMERVTGHYTDALKRFNENNIVICALQGSQNYGLELPTSDVDTKLIVTPSFRDIALDRKPVSTTFVRDNEEHTDDKDIRLYIETFRKQNLNFLEILFTNYYILNPLYETQWNRLIVAREQIAHMNPFRAVKSMKGIALEKYHAMEHRYPAKVHLIETYGYDGKQVSHLIRIEDFLIKYVNGEKYIDCLIPLGNIKQKILEYKLQMPSLEEAREEANRAIKNIDNIANVFCLSNEEKEDKNMRDLLENVSYEIMKISVIKELWTK